MQPYRKTVTRVVVPHRHEPAPTFARISLRVQSSLAIAVVEIISDFFKKNREKDERIAP
jgi:hypothetical protein